MNKEKDIIEFVKKNFKPVAIVLAGSRASGDFVAGSDWDMYVFTNEKIEGGFEEFEGDILDITTVPYPVLPDYIFDTKYHPEEYLRIVFDVSEGWVSEAILRTNQMYKKGPDELSSMELFRLKKIMNRYIKKMEVRKEIPGNSFFYLGIFYEVALRLWFQLRKEWPLPPYRALPYIQAHDPVFHSLLKELFESRNSETQLGAAKKIVSIFFQTKQS